MKELEAISLLEKTFGQNFDLTSFTHFLKELLKDKLNIQNKNIGVAREFEDYIKSFKKIGEYKAKKGNFEILAVELKRVDSLERARTMQRNFVAKWLNNSIFPKDGALVAFYGENPEDWRFSFVKMDYKITGDGKVSKELTPAKRHSFLVGKNEPNHTCKKQFLNLLIEEEISPSLEDLEKAFSVENVTKEFFERYNELFVELTESLEKIKETNYAVKKEFISKDISAEEFGKKLLGQIVFLYFLQKKGWLGVKKDEKGEFNEWGTGPRDFMKKLFKGEIVKYKNFFNDVLEPLFYEALNTNRDNNYYSRFECKVPFLNGGLFEPINNYHWTETNILIDNNIFAEIFKTFDEFNFTIKEDEPLEREVAIDPEMLGKVFENLLEVKDRKSKGAFYTPREIVHYMCQQSLINYLETNTKISRDDLEKFVQKGDLALDYLRRAHEGEYVNNDFLLPPSIYKNVDDLNKLLKEIKICDPAVGSGAFPVGMMNEIIKARQILGYFLTEKQKSDYDLKRETIENCLYGVDLMPSAVDICKLRFWLSLIVDEVDMKNIKPLPNLDNKIMCGNSLIEEFEGVKLFDENLILKSGNMNEKQTTLSKKSSEYQLDILQKLQKEFFNEESRDKKNKLREEIDKIEWEFIETTLKEQNNEDALKKLNEYKSHKSKPFFLWKLYFSDVFNRKNPGFDIIIAYPPYVFTREAKFSEDFKKYVSKNYLNAEESISKSHARQSGKINLYSLFVIMGIKLLRESGSLSFIVPNNLLRTTTYDIVRKFILDTTKIMQIVDLGGGIFKDVTASTILLLLQKETLLNKKENNQIEILSNIEDFTNKKYSNVKITQNNFIKNTSYTFDITLDNKERELFQKIEKDTRKLSGNNGVVIIHAGGIATGPNKKEMIENFKKNEMYKPLLEGKDIKPYYPNFSNKYILYNKNKLYRAREENIFLSPEKIITQRIGGGKRVVIACYDNKKFYTFNSTNTLLPKEKAYHLKYILSILNSKLINWYYVNKFTNKSTLTVNISKTFLEQLPIKKVSEKEQKPFIEIVDRILSITNNKDYLENQEKKAMVSALEQKIDKMVYNLYGLTQEEIKIIEESLK